MIGHLYRYPHPHDPTRFIYVGQGAKRDLVHRRGESSFGRRFKKKFPGIVLPQPIREQINVLGQVELNEEETIRMFQYRTWHGYLDGMNIGLPGIIDYIELGKVGGRVSGRQNVENGHLDKIRTLPQTKAAHARNAALLGRRAVESGLIKRLPALSAEWSKNNPVEHKKISSLGGSKSRDLKSGVHSFSSEQHVNNGKKAGAIALVTGQIQELARKNVESGRLLECLHIRWHVKRNIVLASCSFCNSNS
jgi:hypothetical protein